MMTKRYFRTGAPLLLSIAALAVAAAGCTSATSTSGGTDSGPGAQAAAAPGSSGGGSYQQQILAWGREFAACARGHGQPTFPDPVYPANAPANPGQGFGLALFASVSKTDLGRAIGSCRGIARREPASPGSDRPPSATTLGHMRQFARCMRQQGASGFPDPRADGTFPIVTGPYAPLAPYGGGQVSPTTDRAFTACLRYQVEWRIRAS